MEIQKIFSSYDGERLYSILMTENELYHIQKEFSSIKPAVSGFKKLIKSAPRKNVGIFGPKSSEFGDMIKNAPRKNVGIFGR